MKHSMRVVWLSIILLTAAGCCGMSKFDVDITKAHLYNFRGRYLGVQLAFSRTVRGIRPDDHVTLTVRLYPRSGEPFEHIRKDVEGVKMENMMTIHEAGGDIGPEKYEKFSVTLERDGAAFAEIFVTLDTEGTCTTVDESTFEDYEG